METVTSKGRENTTKPARVRKGGRSVRILPLIKWALPALIACFTVAVFQSCSEYRLYSPDGPIAKRVHDINGMCIAYLFESGSQQISEDYDKYAPQLVKMLNSEAGTLEAIHRHPGSKYSQADLDVIEASAEEMRKLSEAIQVVLNDVKAGKPRDECGSPWYEWLLLDHISKYIDDPHTHMGSKALYE